MSSNLTYPFQHGPTEWGVVECDFSNTDLMYVMLTRSTKCRRSPTSKLNTAMDHHGAGTYDCIANLLGWQSKGCNLSSDFTYTCCTVNAGRTVPEQMTAQGP